MGGKVFANNLEISSKAGDGKVVAEFPDVCLSPPSPPAGPIPVPYPNTSFHRDLKKGSKTVKIGGQPITLKGQSYYKSSPLGNEAATRSFGAGVVTHQITGKTYFQAGSMDVKAESKCVCRHMDLTTSNHGSDPANCAPGMNLSSQQIADLKVDKCPCCKLDEHGDGKKMSAKEWYEERANRQGDMPERPTAQQKKRHQKALDAGKTPKALPPARPAQTVAQQKAAVANLLQRAEDRVGCPCKQNGTKLLPEKPCDIFYEIPSTKADYEAKKETVDELWTGSTDNAGNRTEGFQQVYKRTHGVPPNTQVNHLAPRSAMGCPGSPGREGNLQRHDELCQACQDLDKEFSDFQTVNDSMF